MDAGKVDELEKARKQAYEMFITWSPNPKGVIYGLHSPKKQRGAIQYIIDLFKYIGDGYYVCEFTKNGNIHLHILMNIKNYARYFGRLLPKLKTDGNVNAQAVRNIQRVSDYMSKDRETIKILLGEDAGGVFSYIPVYKKTEKPSLMNDTKSEID